MTLVTISSQNQITIPADYLRDLGLKPGEKFLVDKKNNTLVLDPVKGSITYQLAGSLTKYVPKSKLGKSWKEIMAETNKARIKDLAEKW